MDIVKNMRRYVASFSLAALIASSLAIGVAQAATFSDVQDSDWFFTYVEDLVAQGVISVNDNYYPARNANRAEMAKLITEAFGLTLVDNGGTETFKDVPADAWYYPYVETVASFGVVSGYKDANGDLTGYYGPGNDVTRAEASKMLVLGAPLTINANCGPSFPDVAVNDWFYDYVETSYVNSVIDGYPDGSFGPGNLINRAEIAKMVSNSMNPVLRPCGGFSISEATAMSATTVEVCYTQDYGDGALMVENYAIEDNNGDPLVASTVEATSDPMCTLLTTDPQDESKVYDLTVSDVISSDSEALFGDTASFNGYSTVAAGALTVYIDGSTPDSAPIPKNGANILYSVFGLQASNQEAVNVDQLVISRQGLGLPGDFTNVKLYIDGVQKGGEKTVNTTSNTATFNLTSDPIEIPVDSTVLVEVRADMSAAENSQNTLCIATSDDVLAYGSASAAEVSVGGDFAICGEYMTTTSANVGTLTYKVSQPATSDINIGDTDVVMTKVRMEMANEDVDVNTITFKQIGSADAADFANTTLYLSGAPLDTAVASWDGDFLTFDLTADPIWIEKGNSKTVELWVDAVGGLNTTASFDIYRDWHIEGTGRVYGYGVNVEEDGASVSPTNRDVVGGNIAFALSSNNPIPGDVASGSNDHEFVRFNVSTAGDGVTARKISLVVSSQGGGAVAGNIDDVKIWGLNAQDAWVVVAGPNDITTLGTIGYTDTFDIPASDTTEYIVTADIANGATVGEIYRIDVADTKDPNLTELEYTDGTPVDEANEVTGGVLQGNDQTVAKPSVTISLAATPGDKSYVKNNLNKDLVAFDFVASTADDIKVTGITVSCDNDGGAGVCADAYQTLSMYEIDGAVLTELDGPRSMSTTTTGDGEVVFSLNYTIPSGDSSRLLVRSNIASAAVAADYKFNIGAGNVTAEDSESSSATVNGLATVVRTITIAGNGVVSNQGIADADVNSRILVGQTTDESVLKIRFAADSLEDWYVRSMAIVNAVQYAGGETTSAWAAGGTTTPIDLAAFNAAAGTSITAYAGSEAVGGYSVIQSGDYIAYGHSGTQQLAVDEVSVTYYYYDDPATDNTMFLQFCENAAQDITVGTCYSLNGGANVTEGTWVTETVTVTDPVNQYYGLELTPTGTSNANDAVFVDNIRVGQSADADMSKVYLTYDDGTGDYTAQATMINGIANFNFPASNYLFVPADGNTTAVATVDVGTVTSGGATAGDFAQFLFPAQTNFEAVGASSAAVDNTATLVTGNAMRIAKSAPTVAKVSSSTSLGNGDMTLYELTVTADAQDDLAIKQIAFDNSISDSDSGNELALSNYRLFANGVGVTSLDSLDIIRQSDGNDCESATACIDSTTTSDVILVQWEDVANASEYIVGKGTAVTFELVATAAGVESGDSVSTTLRNDTAGLTGVITLASNQVNVTGTAANFVWSDMSVSPHSSILGSSSTDWLDGYLATGLSTAGSNILSKS